STPGGSNFSHPGLDKTQGSSTGGTMGNGSDVFQTLDKLHGGVPSAAAPQSLPPGHPSVAGSPNYKKQ
ncbi:MAG: hypothetical protein WA299_12160, partial [Candidatus Acidiferrum sp.]